MAGPIVVKVPGAGTTSKVVEQDGRFVVVTSSDVTVNGTHHQGVFLVRFERDGSSTPPSHRMAVRESTCLPGSGSATTASFR